MYYRFEIVFWGCWRYPSAYILTERILNNDVVHAHAQIENLINDAVLCTHTPRCGVVHAHTWVKVVHSCQHAHILFV